jgi:hypothetical protein
MRGFLLSWGADVTRGRTKSVPTPAVEYAVKLPADPEELGLDPHPHLQTRWDEAPVRQWTWLVETLNEVLEVTAAIDISRRYQPQRGPMKAARGALVRLFRLVFATGA